MRDARGGRGGRHIRHRGDEGGGGVGGAADERRLERRKRVASERGVVRLEEEDGLHMRLICKRDIYSSY